jgi:transposase
VIPRFLRKAFKGFEVVDVKEWLSEGHIGVYLKADKGHALMCHRCGHRLGGQYGKYPMKVRGLPIMGLKFWVHFMRSKGYCAGCKKVRSQAISFLSPESPHLMVDCAWWTGRLCEIAPVSRAAELVGMEAITLWRHDHARMKRLLQNYKIPDVKAISVDEVYARKKAHFSEESRDERFFTVISDLHTRRVIWVTSSRSKKALDEFFKIIGPKACEQIQVVAMDQYDGYRLSVEEHCPKATVVWDRFHIMQQFEIAFNECRKDILHTHKYDSGIQKLARGHFKWIFLSKESRRTEEEKRHLREVMKLNKDFYKLELIKERMFTFFDQSSEEEARKVFDEVGDWISQGDFKPLLRWHNQLEHNWNTLKNYFKFKVTSALSEAINNVIKTIKKRAYGYRNMEYFKLKIMQVCGYLNSKFISLEDSMTYTKM